MSEAPDHVDVLILGAGLSGVGAAAHLARELPDLDYVLLERRDDLGGTWDLFRYPGIRSDSDMHTLGYRFRPWTSDKVLADGPSIKAYVRDTADEYGVTDRIRFGHHVTAADFDTATDTWTVTYTAGGETGTITAGFVWGCAGYYSYDEPHTPDFPGLEDFRGQVIHPQLWPEDLDYAGKRVVVIGSGATAITLVPAMAGDAEHVTMLQRSPTYVLPVPSSDPTGPMLRKVLPEFIASGQAKWRNVLIQSALFHTSKVAPGAVRSLIRRANVARLPKDYPVDVHFRPTYDPWDQRLCVVPNGDLFRAIRHGDASVATGHIDTFTEKGIRLQDGTELEADIVITATGLTLQLMGGVQLSVDGVRGDVHDHLVYKSAMLDGVPNLAFVFGYTNASWTLKADLVSAFVVRVLRTMRAKGATRVVPVRSDDVQAADLQPLSSGYIARAVDALPQEGDRHPWILNDNYLLDIPKFRLGKIEDGVLQLS